MPSAALVRGRCSNVSPCHRVPGPRAGPQRDSPPVSARLDRSAPRWPHPPVDAARDLQGIFGDLAVWRRCRRPDGLAVLLLSEQLADALRLAQRIGDVPDRRAINEKYQPLAARALP